MFIFCGVALIAILSSFLFSGATFALKVEYCGKNIATVKSEQDFETAVTLVANSVNGSNVKAQVEQPVYTSALVLNTDINNSNEIAQAIIDNTDAIVSANALKVNGETAVCITEDGLDKLLEARLNSFVYKDYQSVCEFVDSVEIEKGYFIQSEIGSYEDAVDAVNSLQVKTVITVTNQSAIPFSTETRENSNQLRGYSKVIVNGIDGIKQITETITLINGLETERLTGEEIVIQQPTTQVVEIGTARSLVSESDRRVAKSSGFVFPLPRKGWVVSAYFGDGRNHRAVDLACNAGTPIYAVKAGKVIEAGWDGDYGYSIVIDHGNGVQTRYAHEKEIHVKVGDRVNAGEQIGTVGRTGNASGNHLHFEVLINGNRVDPAPYIGLA